MPIYRITFPNKTPVDVQGVSIRTETVQAQIPPSLPSTFTIYATQPQFGSQPYRANAYVNQALSYQVPTIRYTAYFSSGHCQVWIRFYNANGSSYELGSSTSAIYFCNSAYMTPGNTTVSRCDALVTTATGNVLRLQGTNGQPCPTWVTTPDNECRPDEIKCTDLSDPRGFCCISCDALNTKIRVLI